MTDEKAQAAIIRVTVCNVLISARQAIWAVSRWDNRKVPPVTHEVMEAARESLVIRTA